MIIKNWLDMDSVKAMLATGLVDIVTQIYEPQARALTRPNGDGYSIVRQPGLLMRYLGINCLNPVLADGRVRRAIALSVDRKGIVDKAYGGYAIPANQLVTAGRFGFDPKLPQLEYDPIKARKLLYQAGYPDGIDLTLTLPVTSDLGTLLKEQMQASGIRLTLKPLNREEFLMAVDTASLFLLGTLSQSIDAADLLEDAIHSRSGEYGNSNRGRYSNPKVDLLIERASRISEQGQRLRALQEIMGLVMEDMPRVPLVVGEDVYCVSSRISWRPRADMMVLGKEVGYGGKANAR
jgi:peptide/nickel transport system substrate-binding protein